MTKEIVKQFVILAKEYGNKTDNGVATKTEILGIIKICKELNRQNNLDLLKPLIYESDPYVVLLAASSLLKIFPEESIAKLKDLREHELSLAGFEAKWLLREWEDGNYRLPHER